MGADLILEYVWINDKEGADWEGLKTRINNATLEEFMNTGDSESRRWLDEEDKPESKILEEERQDFIRRTNLIQEYFDGRYDRESYVTRIGKYQILFTGGTSWGDSPSDLFDEINDWSNLPFLPEYGFYPDWKKDA